MAQSWLIGSNADCDVRLDRPGVAGRHCRLRCEGDNTVFEDLGSPEGTFLNGTRITQPAQVTPGDAIMLGPSTPLPWPAEAVPPGWQIIRIGRAPENNFVVNLPMVSGSHARLIWNEATRVAVVEDLGSANGTAVGSPDRKASRSVVAATDTVYLGTHPVPASELLALLAPPRRPSLVLRGSAMTIGRDPRCDLVLDSPMISSRHACLTRSGTATLIEDLGSANGTSVNGQRIDRPVNVNPGDVIGLGSYLLEFRGAEAEARAPAAAGVDTEAASRQGAIPATVPGSSNLGWFAAALVAAAAVIIMMVLLLRQGGPPPGDKKATKPSPELVAVSKPSTPKDLTPSPRPQPENPKQEPVPLPPSSAHESPRKPDQTPEPVTQAPRPSPVPTSVTYDLGHLSPEDEIKLGREFNALIRHYHPDVDAGPLLQRVRTAEEPLIAQGGRRFRSVTILDSDEPNAFSHVGGYIYLSWGLFTLIASEDELQFILAHEMAHLERKHAFQSLAAETDAEELAARKTTGTAQQLYRLIARGYLEEEEFEADDLALRSLIQLGLSRRRCLAFLRKYSDYATERDFPNGHNPPRSRPSDPPQDVANHFCAHPAAWERLKRLEAAFDRLKPEPSRAAPK
jgi:pSer/pThr/pTyr-binding forkhead associated (FHA) protein